MTLFLAVAIIMAQCAVAEINAEESEFFERSVRPVLATHCYGCHGAEKQKAGLRLDHGSFVAAGGETGAVLVVGDPAASRIVEAISYRNVDFQMPPKGKLPDEAIAALEEWIQRGAYWPDEPAPTGAPTVEAFDLEARKAAHWAWQPIASPDPPPVQDTAWPRGPVDNFILARLEEEGYAPAPEADRRTLMRRLYFDLTGLPPAPEAIDAYVADESPDAYENLVDELLASEHFGERWGRHWLDLTRYADTYGHEQDYPIRHAYEYRDYVIRALNADVPYDQLVTEHLAGDLLPAPRRNPDQGFNESILGTGFLYMHQATHAPVDVRIDQADRIDNQIDVVSKAFLGMTVACARCHDHKFDAISTKDYYALAGFMRSTRQLEAFISPDGEKDTEHAAVLGAIQERGTRLIKQGFHSAAADTSEVADYLKATCAVWGALTGALDDGAEEAITLDAGAAAIQAVADARDLKPSQLKHWMRRVFSDSAQKSSDPFYAWRRVLEEGDDALAALQNVAPGEESGLVFADFNSPEALAGWTAHGPAFENALTTDETWFVDRSHARLAKQGAVHSGLASDAFEGRLRSRDFTIDHDSMHFHAAGRNAQIRIVIEGYSLREFNGLLFESTLVDVNSGPDFQWYQSIQGLGKHKGRQAYLEFRDEGDGWLAVDEIRFGNGQPIEFEDAGLVPALMADGIPSSAQELAERYAVAASDALTAWVSDSASGSQIDLADALLGSDLIDLGRVDNRLARLVDDYRDESDALSQPMRALTATEGTPQEEHVHLRGNYKTQGDIVPRRFLEALGGEVEGDASGSGRLALARRMFSEEDPLPARVMANRVWMHLFGRGIVPSVDNFGVLGAKPSHPELLDYLAHKFRANGWSIKGLIRELVLSQTYRMQSTPVNAVAEERDPDNVLLHHMNRRRLEGESIRDAVLAAAGTLDDTMYGAPVPAYISPYSEGNRRPEISGPEDGDRRRSIYMEVRRNYLTPMLLAFDFPTPDTTRGFRGASNVPAQALMLMNSPFVVEQAEALAGELIGQESSTSARINLLYERALGRAATDGESGKLEDYIAAQAQQYGLTPEEARNDIRVWTDLCHVMFTLKEFIFLG